MLEPIENRITGRTREPVDLLAPGAVDRLLQLINNKAIFGVHFGTPCTTYSRARKYDGKGPPPLRSLSHLSGLPGLSAWDRKKVEEGSLFMRLSCQIARAAHNVGCFFTIENPASSMLWAEPDIKKLTEDTKSMLSDVWNQKRE